MVSMRSLGPVVQNCCTLDIKRSSGIINTYPGLISDMYVFADTISLENREILEEAWWILYLFLPVLTHRVQGPSLLATLRCSEWNRNCPPMGTC